MDGRVLQMMSTIFVFWRVDNRYYLANAGYAACPELLIPYHGVCYHLTEWECANCRPCNKEELFNLHHAKLCNVIEHIFGVMKKWFKILKDPPGYDMKIQGQIMPALCPSQLHSSP
jgi:hypothetical protein